MSLSRRSKKVRSENQNNQRGGLFLLGDKGLFASEGKLLLEYFNEPAGT